MVKPGEALITVKRQSGENQTITMRDVAKTSGFSSATVSIVLNNAPLARYIAPATKKRIEEVAKKTWLPAQRDGAFSSQQTQPYRRSDVLRHYRSVLHADFAGH